jgi:HEAT repeat protein
MRPLLLLLLVPLFATAAPEDRQIEWVGDFDKAFEIAKERKCPVMVCINSKDREKANDKTARDIYHDPEFVAASRNFVMVVLSTIGHKADGPCPRFGIVTCAEHLHCWQVLAAKYGDVFVSNAARGEMITPQHAWFAPDGTLLARKEYWMDKRELLQRMQRALDDLAAKAKEPPEEGPKAEAPGAPTLTDAERKDLAKAEDPDRETRRTALGNLLSTEKPDVRAAVIDLLKRTSDADVKCDIIRALGMAMVLDARTAIEGELDHKDPVVRSFSCVALEALAQKESIEPLMKRLKTERDQQTRKNVCRALGACGGPVADEEVANTLLKAVNGDKQSMIRKHAALSLAKYTGEKASPLVVPKLEQAALKTKDRAVRSGIVYTLALVGNVKTTEPVLQKILEDQHDEYGKAFLRTALKILRHEGGDFGRSLWFLFSEDYQDPARKDDLPKFGGGGGGDPGGGPGK